MTLLFNKYSTLFNNYSGIVKMWIPSYDNHNAQPSEYTTCIQGILQEDPMITMGNKFQALSDLEQSTSELSNFQQLMGANGVINYLPASAKAWQGTDAITLRVKFYLITISKDTNIMYNLKRLASLLTLKENGDVGVRFHGGYRPIRYDAQGTFLSNTSINSTQDLVGTCKVKINKLMQFQGMLLTKLNFQASTVVCNNHEPLYYEVDATFEGYRAPLVGDLDPIFGGSR